MLTKLKPEIRNISIDDVDDKQNNEYYNNNNAIISTIPYSYKQLTITRTMPIVVNMKTSTENKLFMFLKLLFFKLTSFK